MAWIVQSKSNEQVDSQTMFTTTVNITMFIFAKNHVYDTAVVARVDFLTICYTVTRVMLTSQSQKSQVSISVYGVCLSV